MREEIGIDVLIGKELVKIEVSRDEIIFHTNKDGIFKMYHDQDCCESVEVDEIHGDLNGLLNSPIITASEETNRDGDRKDDDSWTWTFYKISNIYESVTIKWYGCSNGYYSEDVSFVEIKKKLDIPK